MAVIVEQKWNIGDEKFLLIASVYLPVISCGRKFTKFFGRHVSDENEYCCTFTKSTILENHFTLQLNDIYMLSSSLNRNTM